MRVGLEIMRHKSSNEEDKFLLQASIFNESNHKVHSLFFSLPGSREIKEEISESMLDNILFILRRVDSNITKDMILDAYDNLV